MPFIQRILHQNMLNFGTASAVRTDAFADAMTDIANQLDAYDRPVVMGFTEVRSTANRDATSIIAAPLSRFLTEDPIYLKCNTTGVAQAVVNEYVAICVASSFTVVDSGRVLEVSDDLAQRSWHCFTQAELGLEEMPANPASYSRGVCYVVLSNSREQMVVGFLHNMHGNGNRSGTYQKLEDMMGLIRTTHGLAADVPITIGGDFNVEPRPIKRTSQIFFGCARDAAHNPVPTTNANCYDFWLSSAPIDESLCRVFTSTRDKSAQLSDHACVMMKSPL